MIASKFGCGKEAGSIRRHKILVDGQIDRFLAGSGGGEFAEKLRNAGSRMMVDPASNGGMRHFAVPPLLTFVI